jgi:hypothetical protein
MVVAITPAGAGVQICSQESLLFGIGGSGLLVGRDGRELGMIRGHFVQYSYKKAMAPVTNCRYYTIDMKITEAKSKM